MCYRRPSISLKISAERQHRQATSSYTRAPTILPFFTISGSYSTMRSDGYAFRRPLCCRLCQRFFWTLCASMTSLNDEVNKKWASSLLELRLDHCVNRCAGNQTKCQCFDGIIVSKVDRVTITHTAFHTVYWNIDDSALTYIQCWLKDLLIFLLHELRVLWLSRSFFACHM